MDFLAPWLVLFIGGIFAIIILLMACIGFFQLIRNEYFSRNNYILLRNNEDLRAAGMEAEQQAVTAYYPPPVSGNVEQFPSQNLLVEGFSPIKQSTQRSQEVQDIFSQNQLTQSTLCQEQVMLQFPAQGHQTQCYPQQQQTVPSSNLQDTPPQYDELFPSK